MKNENQIKGAINKSLGKAKADIGNAFSIDSLTFKGIKQSVEGSAQGAVGDLQAAFESKAESLKELVNEKIDEAETAINNFLDNLGKGGEEE